MTHATSRLTRAGAKINSNKVVTWSIDSNKIRNLLLKIGQTRLIVFDRNCSNYNWVWLIHFANLEPDRAVIIIGIQFLKMIEQQSNQVNQSAGFSIVIANHNRSMIRAHLHRLKWDYRFYKNRVVLFELKPNRVAFLFIEDYMTQHIVTTKLNKIVYQP